LQYFKPTFVVGMFSALIISSSIISCSGSTGGSFSSGSNNPNNIVTQAISISPISGEAPLSVTVNANASTLDITDSISSYEWDFGDGSSTVTSATPPAHIYTNSNSYTVTLTVTTIDGSQFSFSDKVHVMPTISNSTATIPGGHTFLDNFNYTVNRTTTPSDSSGTNNPFTSTGDWSRAKAENISGSHLGYLYTVNQIPGYQGTFPGYNSTRVLAIEAVPGSMGGQSDFYLQYGQENGPTNAVPADVWFQFWIYTARYNDPADQNDQISAFGPRFKFIYPCNVAYPCSPGNANNSYVPEFHWLNTFGSTTSEPLWYNLGNEDISQLYITTIGPSDHPSNNVNTIVYSGPTTPPENDFKIGQQTVSENIMPNRWTLVTIHYDTSTTAGTFEAWFRPLGGTEVKVAEWISGSTPDFTWTVINPSGHSVFRIPTTMELYDSWIYVDDFVMATARSQLPVYPY